MQPISRCVFTGRAEITVLGRDCIQKLMPAIHIPLILRALRVCFAMPGAFLRRIKLVPVVIYRNTPAGYLGMWLPSPCGGFCQAQSAQYSGSGVRQKRLEGALTAAMAAPITRRRCGRCGGTEQNYDLMELIQYSLIKFVSADGFERASHKIQISV